MGTRVIICFIIISLISCDNRNNDDQIIKSYESGNFEQVISLTEKRILNNESSDFLYKMRGYSYFYLEDYSNAYQDLLRSSQISKDSTPFNVYKTLAACEVMLGRFQVALIDLNSLLQYDSLNVDLLYYRAKCNKELGNYSRAMADYNTVIEINNDYQMAYNDRGLILREVKDYSNAIKDFTNAINLNSNNFAFVFNRGVTYLYLKESLNAINDFNTALNLYDTSIVYYNRAVAYMYLKDKSRCCNDLHKSQMLGMQDIDPILIKYCN